VRGNVDGRALLLGNRALMHANDVDVATLVEEAEALRAEGASVMFLAGDKRLLGLVAVADPIKPSAKPTIAALQASGLRVVMATGDGTTTAQAVARALGIDEFHGEVTPEHKATLVKRLQVKGH
jgi:Cu+-exporting ATPase